MLAWIYSRLERIYGTKLYTLCFIISQRMINIFYPLIFALKGIKKKYREQSNVIVSLTSFPARIGRVHLTVFSLLNQTVRPEKIILYLSKEQFPGEQLPEKLTRLEKSGLFDIVFVDGDIRSHKKYYYSVSRYPDNPVITVDDDKIYPENLIEVLVRTYEGHPGSVCCTHAHRIKCDKGTVLPYSEWDKRTMRTETPAADIIPIGCGGVLYPPHCFDGTDVLDMDKLRELCPLADDLWLKCHSMLSGYDAVISGLYPHCVFSEVFFRDNVALTSVNVGQNNNDVQMNRLLEEYPEFKKMLLSGSENT